MRLKRLDLKAFGPFTDRPLEFNSKRPDFHIIFGPNEAGKSSSLRALKALLYGFPERTTDNFQHPNDQLLVGGCIQAGDGRELAFLRRKKRKADLLDLDGNSLDSGILASFLHGIEPALFSSLYGIDHKTLVQGGEDILAQKGEVGQALFAAGVGMSSLKKILDSLDMEADELFKGSGTKQLIYQAIKKYKELKKVVKEASLASSKWKEHHKRLQSAEAKLDEVELEIKQHSAKVQRLKRLNRAIPELAELENMQKQLQELGNVVVLPPEFSEQLSQVKQGIREIKLQIEKDSDRLKKIPAKQDAVSFNQALLDNEETIEDLNQRLGEYRKGSKDRNKLDGMRITHRKDAGVLIKAIHPDFRLEDVESLRPLLGKKRTIQDLGSQHVSLTQQAFQAQKQKDEAKKELKKIIKTLSGKTIIRETDGLAKAIKPAQRLGDIDGQIKAVSREIKMEQKNCREKLKRIGLWFGELDQLLELTLPLQETIRCFEKDYSDIAKEYMQLKKERQKIEAELKTAKVENNEAAYGGQVPSEQDMADSRNKRQEGWNLLRRQWINGEEISKEAAEYEPGLALHEAYEKKVAQADHIADRLRREADRVAKAASLRARIENLEATILEISGQEQSLISRKEDLALNWRTAWKTTPIKPLSPREMLDWLTDIDQLRFKVSEISNKDNEVTEKDKVRQHCRKALEAELKAMGKNEAFPGSDLGPVLDFAEEVLAELVTLYDQKKQVQTTLDKARKELDDAEVAWDGWHKMWNKSLACLNLTDQLLPSEALDLLDTIKDCFAKLEKAKELQSRIDGIDRDAGKFSADVQTVVEKAAPDLIGLPQDQAALQLHDMLGKARRHNDLLKKYNEEAKALSVEIEDAEKTLQSLDGQMAEFLTTAKCDKAADLAEAIQKFADSQRLLEKISNAESSLAKVSEGVSHEEIKRQADEVNVDELPGQIDSLQHHIEEALSPSKDDILKLIGEEKKELELMDGSGRAAEAAEEMERIAARIRRLVNRYTRIKLAAMVLKDEIERYREKHQDPVLQIASKLFVDLTIGSFSALRTDVDDKGNPVLVGIRPDNSRLTVTKMSSGTCDQLYLALRLATLKWRHQTSEPMPFVVDDILINFDDARSRATLKVLADLAKETQVILFTHHGFIVDDAKQMDTAVTVHEL